MIVSIHVKRPYGAVDYCSRVAAINLARDCPGLNIISISGTDESDAKFQNASSVLYLRGMDWVSDFDLDVVEAHIASLGQASILVHCQMGISRSKWLAEWIAYKFDRQLAPVVQLISSRKR